MTTQSVGAKIRAARKAADLTQREAANFLEVDFTYISKIENMRLPRPPSQDLLIRMGRLYERDGFRWIAEYRRGAFSEDLLKIFDWAADRLDGAVSDPVSREHVYSVLEDVKRFCFELMEEMPSEAVKT